MKPGDLLLCKIKYAPEIRGWVDEDRYFRPNQEYMITKIDEGVIYVAFEPFIIDGNLPYLIYDWKLRYLWEVFYKPQEVRKLKLEKIKNQ